MGYDLIPRNRKVNDFNPGAFTWPIILQETGCGFLIGYGAGRCPASYVYQPQGNNGSPVSNDGFIVSSKDSKAMHDLCMGYISVKKFINNEWNKMDEEEKKRAKDFKGFNGLPLYVSETAESFLDKIEAFAKFSKESGGFRIR